MLPRAFLPMLTSMAGSVVVPSHALGPPRVRRLSYTCEQPPPPLPPRRNSLAVAPGQQQQLGKKLQLIAKKQLLSVGRSVPTTPTQFQPQPHPQKMDSRYHRPSSPRARITNPARSSTGTFDPYYDSNYYTRPSSPRSSADRLGGSLYPRDNYVTTTASSGSRSAKPKYDSYTGRPRRNTLNESDDRLVRPQSMLIPSAVLPLRTHATHVNDRPSSPLARSWDNRADPYVGQAAPRTTAHKRIYSVDDGSHSAKLIAEKDIVKSSHRDSRDYSITSGRQSYHQHKPLVKATEFGDEGFSYTDPAAMYRETEPAWRRPRASSIERGARPSSVVLDRGPRTSTRELGPPPSTRGFDKINAVTSRHHARSSSIERSRDIPKYDSYPDAAPSRTSSTRHHTPAIHQESREHRREPYRDEYDDRRDRDVENRRYADRFEDRDVPTRGFGIAPTAHVREPALDHPPIYNANPPEVSRGRAEGYGSQYYSTDRADVRMPDPRIPEPRIPDPRIPDARIPDARIPRERDVAPTYEERPRERASRDSNQPVPSAAPIVAGAAAGAAATFGAAHVLKSREKEREREPERDRERERERERERDRERDREREREREREQRKEYDERDRRGRGSDERERRADRREAVPEERQDRPPQERVPPPPPPPPPGAYPSTPEPDRIPRERAYEDEDRDRRERRARKVPSSEGSGDERPRHYVDSQRKPEPPVKEAALDPDEEYRRRIQQEAERSGRDRDNGDSDRERDRRRRRDEREKSRERGEDNRSREARSNAAEPPHSRYDERSASVLDANLVQEPDSLADHDPPSKAVQIVTPPKEAPPAPKGILRKPTEKFPEDPEPIREGVAPHKSQLKGKDIPPNARWTKIDRRLVNPQALEEAQERFEERLDCVIVLRVLTKEDIQKLADRTRKIREARGTTVPCNDPDLC